MAGAGRPRPSRPAGLAEQAARLRTGDGVRRLAHRAAATGCPTTPRSPSTMRRPALTSSTDLPGNPVAVFVDGPHHDDAEPADCATRAAGRGWTTSAGPSSASSTTTTGRADRRPIRVAVRPWKEHTRERCCASSRRRRRQPGPRPRPRVGRAARHHPRVPPAAAARRRQRRRRRRLPGRGRRAGHLPAAERRRPRRRRLDRPAAHRPARRLHRLGRARSARSPASASARAATSTSRCSWRCARTSSGCSSPTTSASARPSRPD